MNELLKRTLTGTLIVAVIIGAVFAGRPYMLVLTAFIGTFCLLEMRALSGGVAWKYLLGSLYVTVGLLCLLLFYLCLGRFAAMGFFVLIWASDIFAYLIGSAIGKHKLCPIISPSKTWEGAIGGFVVAMGLGCLWKFWFLPEIAWTSWLLLSAGTIVAGVLGDLQESKMKRKAGVKDSGKFLPGHGGMLDRFDSVLLAAPVAFLISLILNLF